MSSKLVLTFTADDQTGLVKKVSKAITEAGGNWLESSMSQLAGRFAGIILVGIAEQARGDLEGHLAALRENGLDIHISEGGQDSPREPEQLLVLEIVAHDRPGIVRELSALLASLNVNVESLDTTCTIAAMSSEHLFEASAVVGLPDSLDEEGLEKHLGTLSDDLMVEIHSLSDADGED